VLREFDLYDRRQTVSQVFIPGAALAPTEVEGYYRLIKAGGAV